MKQLISLFAALLLIPLVGCGAGGSHETTGRLTVNVTWPEPSRLIPAASNSIKIEIFDGGSRVAFRTINRPATSASFSGLPVANLLLKATAYPEDPGDPVRNGVISQATGTTIIGVQAGSNPAVNVTMNSTIDHIAVTSATLVVNGPTQALTATAHDAGGNVVLLTPAALEWTSGTTAVATVTNAGVVTAVSPGVSVITVRDTESNKTGTAPVTVSSEGGTANVTVNNPPTGTRSVRIEISNGAQTLASRNLAWLTGASISDSFTGVPAGTHTVTATAFSQDSGGGTALGSASGNITVPSLGSGSATLNITSLVDTIEVTPDAPTVLQGQSIALNVVAHLTGGGTATLVNSSFNWNVNPTPPGAATVNANGVVSTSLAGSAVVTATDPRTSGNDSTNVTITSNSASAGGVVRSPKARP